MIFLVLNYPRNMHIEFLCISEVAAGKNDMFSFQIEASHLHIGLKWLYQPEIGFTTLLFFQNQHTYYHIDFELFINNGGRTWNTKWFQHNIYIFISIGINCVCRLGHSTTFVKWQGDIQYVGIIEKQKQQIKQLQEELAGFNPVQYKTLQANASRGENILRSSKKVSMTPTDYIN